MAVLFENKNDEFAFAYGAPFAEEEFVNLIRAWQPELLKGAATDEEQYDALMDTDGAYLGGGGEHLGLKVAVCPGVSRDGGSLRTNNEEPLYFVGLLADPRPLTPKSCTVLPRSLVRY